MMVLEDYLGGRRGPTVCNRRYPWKLVVVVVGLYRQQCRQAGIHASVPLVVRGRGYVSWSAAATGGCERTGEKMTRGTLNSSGTTTRTTLHGSTWTDTNGKFSK